MPRSSNVTDDIAVLKYNTCIAALMEYLNGLEARQDARHARGDARAAGCCWHRSRRTSPMSWWQHVNQDPNSSVHSQPWPAYDEAALRRETVTIVVQVNGKVRGQVEMPPEVE